EKGNRRTKRYRIFGGCAGEDEDGVPRVCRCDRGPDRRMIPSARAADVQRGGPRNSGEDRHGDKAARGNEEQGRQGRSESHHPPTLALRLPRLFSHVGATIKVSRPPWGLPGEGAMAPANHK